METHTSLQFGKSNLQKGMIIPHNTDKARFKHDSIISVTKYMSLHFIKFYYVVTSNKMEYMKSVYISLFTL